MQYAKFFMFSPGVGEVIKVGWCIHMPRGPLSDRNCSFTAFVGFSDWWRVDATNVLEGRSVQCSSRWFEHENLMPRALLRPMQTC